MREHIQFDFIYDNHFAELREMEIMQNRLTIAAQAEPYLGKYFSVYQVRNRLLGYTDGEIKEIDQQISYEKNVGIIPDPNAQLLMRPRQPGMGGEIQGDMNMAAMQPGQEGDMDFGGGAPADPGLNMGGMGGAVGGGGGAGGPVTMPS